MSTSIRWALAKHLVKTIRDKPAATGVLVEPGYPGDVDHAEVLWIDDISDSTNQIPVISGGRMHRDDFFTIVFLSRVTGRKDLDSTMTRLEEIGALIENPVADEPTLNGFASLMSADFVTTDLTCGQTPDGPVGYARHEVRAHSRLT